MPGPVSPVSACALKELEIIGGHSSRVYDSTQLADALTLTLEGQQTKPNEKLVLCLLVNSGLRRILSIRLSDLLPTVPPFLQVVSTKADAQQLRIDVQEQDHAVIATFEHKREFNLAVYMLHEYGFSIKEVPTETLEFGHDYSQTTTLAFENPTGLGPRLSSITTFPELVSGTNSHSQVGLSWEPQTGSMTSDIHPGELLSSHSSMSPQPHQIRQTSFPPSSSNTTHPHHSPYMAQLNPYNVFLGKQAYSDYRPKISSPLRNALSPNKPLRYISHTSHPPSQDPLRLSLSPTPIPPPAIGDVSPRYDSPFNVPIQTDYAPVTPSHSSTLSAKFPPSPISTYRHHSDSNTEHPSPNLHHIQDIMPQPRSLPFDHLRKELQINTTDDQNLNSEEQSPGLNSQNTQGKRKRKPKDSEIEKDNSPGRPKKKSANKKSSPKLPALSSFQGHTSIKSNPVVKTPTSNQRGTPPKKKNQIVVSKKKNQALDPKEKTQDVISKKKNQDPSSLSPTSKATTPIREEKPKKHSTIIESVDKPKQKLESKPKPRSRVKRKGQLPNNEGNSPPGEVMSPVRTNPKSALYLLAKGTEKQDAGHNESPKKGVNGTSRTIDPQSERRSSRLAMKSRSGDASVRSSAKGSPQQSNAANVDQEINSESLISERPLASEIVQQKQESPQNGLQPTPSSISSFAKSELALLVTDEMLRQVNAMTSDLFDQFEADLKRGSNGATLAQYYLGQIMDIRKDFWQSEFAKTGDDTYTTIF